MKTLLKSLCMASVLTLVMLGGPSTANAQRNAYWNNHWGWYDNTYRPYNNYYYGNGYYGGYNRPYYNGYYNGYYNPGYYGPNVYVNPGVGVHVGRMNFGWW